jgi:hypothetical protein
MALQWVCIAIAERIVITRSLRRVGVVVAQNEKMRIGNGFSWPVRLGCVLQCCALYAQQALNSTSTPPSHSSSQMQIQIPCAFENVQHATRNFNLTRATRTNRNLPTCLLSSAKCFFIFPFVGFSKGRQNLTDPDATPKTPQLQFN